MGWNTVLVQFPLFAVRHVLGSQREPLSFPLLEAPQKVRLPHRVERHAISALYAEKIELVPGCGVGRKRVEERLRRDALRLWQEGFKGQLQYELAEHEERRFPIGDRGRQGRERLNHLAHWELADRTVRDPQGRDDRASPEVRRLVVETHQLRVRFLRDCPADEFANCEMLDNGLS